MYILGCSAIQKHMLQFKRFEGILNRKWLLSCRNNDISYKDARAGKNHDFLKKSHDFFYFFYLNRLFI